MAVATIDPVVADVVFVAEGDRLFDRIVEARGIRHLRAPQVHPGQPDPHCQGQAKQKIKSEMSRKQLRHRSSLDRATPRNLSHRIAAAQAPIRVFHATTTFAKSIRAVFTPTFA
jgi:hypothetical protein